MFTVEMIYNILEITKRLANKEMIILSLKKICIMLIL